MYSEYWTERTGLKFIPSLHLILGGNIDTLIEVDTLTRNNQIIAVVNWKGASALLCDLLRKMSM